MAPIDLPPEPSLHQLSTVSISTVSPKTKHSGTQHSLTHHYSAPSHSQDRVLAPVFSPRSLIPAGQLSAPSSDDFSKPNLAQLPILPSETDTAPAAIDEETLDTVNDTIDELSDSETIDAIDELSDTEMIETIEPANIEAIEPLIDTGEIESEAVDLDHANPDDIIELEAIDLNEVEPGDLDAIDQVPDTLEELEETDLDAITSDESTTSTDSDASNSAVEFPTADTATPLDPSKLEITADTQIFNSDRQVVIARGNVVFKLNNAFLLADELWVNLVNRYVLAEGNVILTSGEQEVRGERAEYNLLQEAGTIFETRGELFFPDLEDDFASPTEGNLTSRTVFDPLNPDSDIANVRGTGGFAVSSEIRDNTPGSFPEGEGGIKRLRFEAARVNFDAETWVAEEVRLTNDPFSPPEVEFRTDRMTLVSLSPTADLLTTEDPRLVFDQGLALPLFKSRYILNRGAADSRQIIPFGINIGSDSQDRGGLFVESEFSIVRNAFTNLSVTPQYFVERASNQGATDLDVFGIEVDFDTRLSPTSDLSARATLTSFNLNQIDDNLRGYIRNRYLIGKHKLTAEYSYRDRFFNGSLGFQDVQSSVGALLLSPPVNLDGRGLIWTYQIDGRLIRSRTDRIDLLGRPRRGGDEDLITLGRVQASTRLRKRFNLWRGKPLAATQDKGLRYSPVPLVPNLNLTLNLVGVGAYYTSDELTTELSGDIRLDGQFGHLSKNFFDYTRFNIGYSEDIVSDDRSPFLFDRDVDRRVLSFGILQQIIGPFLLGFQTSININTRKEINTDIILQYSRRTYGIVARYSPTRETGSIGFRLSDFNWLGSGSPFDEPNIRQVENGLAEQR